MARRGVRRAIDFWRNKEMRHFLSEQTKPRSDALHLSRATMCGRSGPTVARDLCLVLLACISFLSPSFAQHPFTTGRADNSRSNANPNETLLTRSNVNKAGFGLLFSAPVDNVV